MSKSLIDALADVLLGEALRKSGAPADQAETRRRDTELPQVNDARDKS